MLPVFFSYDDGGIKVAVASFPNTNRINHLLCVFHLFDQNTKQHVQSAISDSGSASGWTLFRSGLSECREAKNEDDLIRL